MPEYVYATCDNSAEKPNDLSYTTGERIEVYAKGEGWWMGRTDAGKSGLFLPKNISVYAPGTEPEQKPAPRRWVMVKVGEDIGGIYPQNGRLLKRMREETTVLSATFEELESNNKILRDHCKFLEEALAREKAFSSGLLWQLGEERRHRSG
jgi:hypothetical protein